MINTGMLDVNAAKRISAGLNVLTLIHVYGMLVWHEWIKSKSCGNDAEEHNIKCIKLKEN